MPLTPKEEQPPIVQKKRPRQRLDPAEMGEKPNDARNENLDTISYALDDEIEVRNWRYHLTNDRL